MTIRSEVLAAIKTPFDDNLFKRLVRQVHPDVDPSLIDLFHALNKWRDDKDIKITIKAGQGYVISTPIYDSHISKTYECKQGYLKVSKHPKANSLIKNEFDVLTDIRAKLPSGLNCDKYFFEPIEFLRLKDKVELTAYSYVATEGLSLKTVMEHRPNGLSDPEFGWIFKRILAGIDFLHMAGYTHTNITEDHIVIRPETHGLYVCGLAGATKDAPKMKLADQPFNGLELDTWQIGQLGKRLTKNKRFLGFIQSLTLAKHYLPTDLAAVSKELEEILPPRKFVPFTL